MSRTTRQDRLSVIIRLGITADTTTIRRIPITPIRRTGITTTAITLMPADITTHHTAIIEATIHGVMATVITAVGGAKESERPILSTRGPTSLACGFLFTAKSLHQ